MAHILVIDDEAEIRNIVREFLTAGGHTVDTAADGKTGLELAHTSSYQLVITDVIMPGRDGLEVATELRNSHIGIAVLAITGGGPRIDLEKLGKTAEYMGADKVLLKPFTFQQLIETVDELLNLYR